MPSHTEFLTLPDTSDRTVTDAAYSPNYIIPEAIQDSYFLNAVQQIGGGWSIFSEDLYSRRDNNNSYNPIPLQPTPPPVGAYQNEDTVSSGLIAEVGLRNDDFGGWYVEGFGTFGHTTTDYAVRNTPILEAYAAASTGTENEEQKTASGELRASRALFSLPGGMVKAAFGASYRSETAQQSFDITNLQAVYPFSRKISAAYGEVSAPLVSESNALPWLKSLVLSVAGRYEHYSDFGHTANPRVGLALKPTDGLTLRATYSTSFRAPNNLEETGSSQGVFYDAADTASPTGTSTILYLTGVNNHLTPETARNVTFGLDIRPIDLPALLLSVDYYHIDYSNRIVQPDPDDEGLFSLQAPTIQGLVTRSPTSAEVLAALANVGLLGNYTGNPELNPGSVNPAFVQAIVNALYQNFAVVRTDGIDFSGSYLWESPLGRLHPSIQATYIHSLEQQLSPDSAFQSLVNTIYNPPKFRGRLGIAWDKAGWNSAVFVNYVNAYTDNRIVTTPVPISSWTTADFHIGYTFADNFSLLGKGKTEIALDVTNFLNKEPPYVSLSVGGFNYDPANSSALGRVLAVGIVKSW